LADQTASVWLFKETLTIAYEDALLAQYGVTPAPGGSSWEEVREVRQFPARYPSAQLPLWDLAQIEWRKALRVERAPRRDRATGSRLVQAQLFA
jgi:hypothetical protein